MRVVYRFVEAEKGRYSQARMLRPPWGGQKRLLCLAKGLSHQASQEMLSFSSVW